MQYPYLTNPYNGQQYFTQQPQQPTSSFVVVQSEDDIRRYAVAPGSIVTFRIENQPVIVEKSLGFSQFDTPHYKRFKMIEEDMPIPEAKEYLLKSDYETSHNDILAQIKDLQKHLSELEKKPGRKKVDDE